MSQWARLKTEAGVYVSHIGCLFVAGRLPRSHDVLPKEVKGDGYLVPWGDDDLDLLIIEGRHAIDLQHARFDRTRATAQVLLPVGIALLIVFGTRFDRLGSTANGWIQAMLYALWAVGTVLVLLSALGAAATLAVRADFGAVLPKLLSHQSPPIRAILAASYAEQSLLGEATVATRLTVVRDAVSLLAWGGALHVVLWAAERVVQG